MIFDPQLLKTNGMEGACSTYGLRKGACRVYARPFQDKDSCAHSNKTSIPLIGEIFN